jgi:transposase
VDREATAPLTVLFGLDGFEVVAAADAGGELEIMIETTAELVGCPECGAVATAKDRRPAWVADLPIAGRPVVLCWVKRICSASASRSRTVAVVSRGTFSTRFPRSGLASRAITRSPRSAANVDPNPAVVVDLLICTRSWAGAAWSAGRADTEALAATLP